MSTSQLPPRAVEVECPDHYKFFLDFTKAEITDSYGRPGLAIPVVAVRFDDEAPNGS